LQVLPLQKFVKADISFGCHVKFFEIIENITMNIKELISLLDGKLVCGNPQSDYTIHAAFASDLMSDVLTLDNISPLLITGLCNLQTIRTAEMADIHVIVIARGKKVTEEMIQLAMESNIILIETPFSVFRSCGILYQNHVKPVF